MNEPVRTPRDAFFLPNFCDVRMVFAVVVIGELLAFVLTLAPFTPGDERWSQLSVISLFVQWVGLTSAAVLCHTRRYLGRLRENTAATVSYALLLLVTLVLSEIAYRIALLTGFGWEVASSWHMELLLRNLAISAVVNAVTLRYFYVQHQWEQQVKAESHARIAALQARIRPHFLFNSINAVMSLVRSEPQRAERALQDLADLFRVLMKENRELVRLEDEVNLCWQYLELEHLRLGDRLQIAWHIDKMPKDAMVPPLILQPLLENAVYHGIEPAAVPGEISINIFHNRDQVSLAIKNPYLKEGSHHEGNKMAMQNIRERLQLHFDSEARLKCEVQGDYYMVHITLPYVKAPP